ncbi:unnamed protein product, partial [Laminaria digitata]
MGSVPMDMDRRQAIRRPESPPDFTAFESVRQGLADSNTVGWQLAPTSIDLATRHFRHIESLRFLKQFLHQVTGIMLDQHVSKMESFQKSCALRTLTATANVLPLLLKDGRKEFIATLVLLLDPSKSLYLGSKTAWTSLPGAPEQRIKLCAQLVTNEGFGAATMLLENQALRLERQARLRSEAKVVAANTARRAQLAQAEARQAATAAGAAVAARAGAGVGGSVGEGSGEEFSPSAASAASAAAAKAIEVARLATEASEVAAAAAAATLAKGEQWLGADSLAVLLGGLVDCT